MGMFDQAKAVTVAKPKASGKSKAEVAIVGLEQLAMVVALEKALEGIHATLEGEVKAKASELFVQHVRQHGTKPESFKGTEGGASASLELRRKGSNIALTEPHVALLREHGIEPHKEVTTPKLFGINPAYADDAALLGKVEAALAAIVPADFIVMQDERAKFTVTDEVLARALVVMRDKPEAPAELLASMTTLACKPKLVNTDLAAILQFVQGLLVEPSFGEAATQAKVVQLHLVKAA